MSRNLGDDYADGIGEFDYEAEHVRAMEYADMLFEQTGAEVEIYLDTNRWGQLEWEATVDGEVVDTDEYLDNILSTLDRLLLEKTKEVSGE